MGLRVTMDGNSTTTSSFYIDRMAICQQCPLYKQSTAGAICNSRLWLNVNTGETSKTSKPGFKNGCGCKLSSKTKLSYTHCPVGKW